jgi:predicted permease
MGRAFGPDEREPDRADVVLISHALWQSRFGGDGSILGRRVELDGSNHATRQVIGIMPRDFVAPLTPSGQRVDLWAPLSVGRGRTIATDSTWYVNQLVGRLAPGATVERAATEVRATMARLREQFSGLIDEEAPRTAGASGLLDAQVGDVRRPLWILLSAVGLVLMLVCANLANLLLARGERRRQELAVRAALGAGRGRLVRAQLTESALLAVAGAAGGVILARTILAGLRVADVSGLPRLATLQPDVRVIGFALAVTALALIGFGVLPSWRSARADVRDAMGSAGRTQGRTRSGRRIGFALVAGEVMLAMVLVTGAGLLLGSLRALRAVDSGIDTSDVLALELAPPLAKYTGERNRLFYEQVAERLAALPGVRAVGAIQLLPFTDANWSFPYLAEGNAPPADGRLPSANFRIITRGYFAAVDVPLLAGRALESTDDASHPTVAWINRTFAEQHWPGEDPIGKEVKLFGNQPFRVAGVVGDVRQHALDRASSAEIYGAHTQWQWAVPMTMMIEADVPPSTLIDAASRAVWEIDPNVPVVSARPLDDVLGESLARRRFFANVLSFFGVLALALGAVGVYGVMAYWIGARIPEFGLRMALGATRGSVLRGALGEALVPVAVGLVAGVIGAVAAARLIASLLYGIAPRDPVTLVVAAIVLGAVATIACWLPARRVTRVDPAGVLRSE